jgi:hypothetical protein
VVEHPELPEGLEATEVVKAIILVTASPEKYGTSHLNMFVAIYFKYT